MANKKAAVLDPILNLISMILVVVCLWVAYPSAKTVFFLHDSRSWPEVEGQVVSATLEYEKLGEDSPGQRYLPRVWFGYVANDKKYVSSNYQFSQEFTSVKSVAEDAVKQYPAGGKIKVRYWPKNPEVAVVDSSNVPMMDCFKLGIGIFAFFVGFTSLSGFLSRGRKG